MSTVPASEPAAKRRIGDILLAHNFVTEAQLADATAEQERTGQPLGQILVQHGSITRLELASALAEQWSDPSASISLVPRPVTGLPTPTPTPQDEAQYAARLQDAVAALARKVQTSEPLEGIDQRVTELARRIESTLARTQHIEAAVATLADSLEGVTGGVEEAFVALQAGTSELAAEFARIDRTVEELALQTVEAPNADPELLAEVEELRSAVAALAAQPTGVEVVSQRLEEIASRFDTLVDAAALDDLRGALRELEGRANDFSRLDARLDQVEALASDRTSELSAEFARIDRTVGELAQQTVEAQTADPELLAEVEELRSTVAALAAQPTGVEVVAQRLEEIASRFDTLVDAAALEDLRGALSELESRANDFSRLDARLDQVEALASDGSVQRELEGQATALAELREVVSELAMRPSGTADLDLRLGELEATFEARLETALAGLDETTIDTDALEARLESAIHRHEVLAASVEELDVRVERLPLEDGRVGDVLGRLEGLEERLDHQLGALEELRSAVAATPDPALGAQISELTDQVAQLSADRADNAALTARLEELDVRVKGLPLEDGRVGDVLGRLEGLEERLDHQLGALEELRGEVSATSRAAASDRFEELSVALDLVRDELAGLASPAAPPDPALAAQISELTERVAELSADRTDNAALTARLEAVELGPAEGFVTREALAEALERVRPQGSSALYGRFEELAAKFEKLRTDLSEAPESNPTAPGLPDDVERLALRVEELARYPAEADLLAAKLEALESARESDLDTIGVLARALDRIRHDLASAPAPPEQSDGQGSAIAAAVTELAGRLTRLEAVGEPGTAIPVDQGLESELEHVRLALERLGLHLAEHERTLATLQHSRGLTAQVEELAARIEELAAAADDARIDTGAPAPVGGSPDVHAIVQRVAEAEAASQADREKLMNRLERLATSMDWRLQRLEAGEAEE